MSSSTNCNSTSFFDGKAHWLNSFKPSSKRRFPLTSFTTRFSLHSEGWWKSQLSFRTFKIRRSPIYTIGAEFLIFNINCELLFQIGSQNIIVLATYQQSRKNYRSAETIKSDCGTSFKNKTHLESRSHFTPQGLLYLSGLILRGLDQQLYKHTRRVSSSPFHVILLSSVFIWPSTYSLWQEDDFSLCDDH